MTDQNNKPEGRIVVGTVPPKEDIISMVGEGVHTGLRKGSEAPSSGPLWQAISRSTDGAWKDALEYFLWGLRYSGWEIVKVSDDSESLVKTKALADAYRKHDFESSRDAPEGGVEGCAVCGRARGAVIHNA